MKYTYILYGIAVLGIIGILACVINDKTDLRTLLTAKQQVPTAVSASKDVTTLAGKKKNVLVARRSTENEYGSKFKHNENVNDRNKPSHLRQQQGYPIKSSSYFFTLLMKKQLQFFIF